MPPSRSADFVRGASRDANVAETVSHGRAFWTAAILLNVVLMYPLSMGLRAGSQAASAVAPRQSYQRPTYL